MLLNLHYTPLTKDNTIEIALPLSKSESNRVLILSQLSEGKVKAENYSEADDTQVMQKHLKSQGDVLDVGHAGTTMRFLTAYFSALKKDVILTGSERMKERPIKILVEALQQIGVHIEYLEKEGYPPIAIKASHFEQQSSLIKISGKVSSQYLSALLMIAPLLPKGLTLEISDELTSVPYLKMTLTLLEQCGIKHQWTDNRIAINPGQSFHPTQLEVEADWSGASYWYVLVALMERGKIFLKGLKKNSYQGDSVLNDLMLPFGVKSLFSDGGAYLEKVKPSFTEGEIIDCSDFPDLAQSLVTLFVGLRKRMKFTGLHTLRIKETDRIAALQEEIKKFGAELVEEEKDIFVLRFDPTFTDSKEKRIKTYHDHRMAMAFAPLSIKFDKVQIEDAGVVSKSYPRFWQDLEKIGFTLTTKE